MGTNDVSRQRKRRIRLNKIVFKPELLKFRRKNQGNASVMSFERSKDQQRRIKIGSICDHKCLRGNTIE